MIPLTTNRLRIVTSLAFCLVAGSFAPYASAAWVQSAGSGSLSTTDLFDVSNGVSANLAGGRPGFPGDDPNDAIGQTGPVEPDSFIFADATTGPGFISIEPSAPTTTTTIDQVRLVFQADGNGDRKVTAFEFYGITEGGAPTLLFNDADLAPEYAAGTANRYDEVFTSDTPVSFYRYQLNTAMGTTGARVMEIDAFLMVPEPGSLALIGLGGLCLLRRRRS